MARKEIVFHEASSQNAQAFLDFMQQVSSETDYIVLDETDFRFQLEEMECIFRDMYENPRKLCLLASIEDEVIGTISVQSVTSYPICHIGSVFMVVKQDYWGYGIGTILLEEAVNWARESGLLHRLELTVQVRNEAAVHLYQKMGFVIEGTQRHGARTNEGEWLDLYYMGQLLDDR